MTSSNSICATRLFVALCLLLSAPPAIADNVLSRISIPSRHLPHHYYGQLYQFPEEVRDYTNGSLYGYSFREERPGGAVRELEIARLRSRGAYLIATDLFSNGRFSTMSHTVLIVFPRPSSGWNLYQVVEDLSGDLRVLAPDGSILLIDGESGAVRPTRDFALLPPGLPGTPPDLRHRGLHVEIRATGRSPFLRGTAAKVVDGNGSTCPLSTNEIFRYGIGPESDVFRFDEDADFFAFLSARCPGLRVPRSATTAVARTSVAPEDDSVPILIPASGSAPIAPATTAPTRSWSSETTGSLPFLWQLFSR